VAAMAIKIEKNKIGDFLQWIMENYSLYAPVREKVTKFARIENTSQICFLPNRTSLSLKPLFFPPEETFFKWKKSNDGYIIEDCLNGREKKVIFGVRGCDVRSLKILDMYMSEEFSDPYYTTRREDTIIIGMTCDYPEDTCFCTAFGGMIPDEYDLWLTDIGTHYFVDVGSENGKELICKDFFEEATPQDEIRRQRKIECVEYEIEKRAKIDLSETKNSFQQIKKGDNKIWEELSEICLCCGRCNFICPTCHCFDVRDITNLNGIEGERIRVWDSCHLFEYAQTAAEHFRKERVARVKYRIYDKFIFPVMRYGVYACTGCGRCADVCPAGIDIYEVLRRLID